MVRSMLYIPLDNVLKRNLSSWYKILRDFFDKDAEAHCLALKMHLPQN